MLAAFALRFPFVLAFLLAPISVRADKLSIISTPPGATVEINGVKVGTTPYEKEYPGGYFHRTKTAFGSRLEHRLVARVTLPHFAVKQMELCDGPIEWKDIRGRNRGEYWTFKASTFTVSLNPIGKASTGETAGKADRGSAPEFTRDLPLEEVVARTKPAVVYLEGLDKSGTGFFVTGTGLIATNAHVARGEDSLLASMPGGVQLNAQVLHIDENVDVALLKVEGVNFPHLSLVESSMVRQGQPVLAIGNPGQAMLFSVTKGIVSGIQEFQDAGPGTWIQTDAPINPGNSGGPLVNMQGEVIGITTSRPATRDISGIGFALSASDLKHVMEEFYRKEQEQSEKLAAPPKAATASCSYSDACALSKGQIPARKTRRWRG